uniref:Solute carrier family 15 member 1b n=1 Tax=Amphilophus citrinellus TaxID=61819 RepID=A0A3Q0SVL7_AMPCI
MPTPNNTTAIHKQTHKQPLATICGYPLSIFFIIVNEFCERFSYYGMRTVLVLYFKYFLLWDEDFATTIYHTFVALCYLTPILGAIVADSWLGKFKTIVYLSIVYAIGQVVMAVSAISDITDTDKNGTPDNMTFHIALSMLGLILIALGTGGIKPCVSAFGGDQFQDHQEKQRSTFFSIFYLSINAGSLISTLTTPIHILIFLFVFIIGSPMYTKNPPEGNIMVKFGKCVGFAVKNRFRHRSSQYPKREHWMDWAEEKYDKLLIAQVKMVLKVLFLYIPLPMFWALFDQQGSRWTFQATTMNGNFGALTIQPDQMQTVNPILILILVPVMDSVVYPLISKCFNFTPLKRMTVGMFFAALAFVAAALVQIQIDKTLPDFPSSTQGQVKFINMVNSKLEIQADNHKINLGAFEASEDYLTFNNKFFLFLGPKQNHSVTLDNGTRNTIAITEGSQIKNLIFSVLSEPSFPRFLNGFGSFLNITVRDESNMVILVEVHCSDWWFSLCGSAKFIIKDNNGNVCDYTQELGFGSSYTLIIPPTFRFGDAVTCKSTLRRPNSFHMAWQIPQYFLMTSGEVVFSVTGLEFSYSQAPSNMKAVLQAGWLLTVAVGNIIVLIVAEAAKLPDQWAEYILFASLLVLVCIIFAIMGYFYTYIDPAKIEAQFAEMDPEKKEKMKNLEMPRKGSVEGHKEERRSSDSSCDDEETRQTKI